MNETNYLEGKLYVFSHYIAQMLLINFFFVIGTLIGFVAFGIGPSMYASLKLIKEIKEDEKDSNLFVRFMKYYRENFIKANKIFFSYVLIFGVFAINVSYYSNQLSNSFFKVGILTVNYILILIVFISFTTYIGLDIRMNYNLKDKIKSSILFPMYYIKDTLLYFIAAVAMFCLLVLFSQFIAFLFAAGYCYLNHHYVGKMVGKFNDLMETNPVHPELVEGC